MQVLRSPAAELSCLGVRPCTDKYRKPCMHNGTRIGAPSDTRRRQSSDLRCCSVTASSQSLSSALAQPLIRDSIASVVVVIAAACLIITLSFLRTRGIVDRTDTRKITHVLAGPSFLAVWPLYSGSGSSALLSALPAGVYALFLALIGSGAVVVPGVANSISRSGNRAELLRGPLVYAGVLAIVALGGWQCSLPGICAVCIMCGGDGFADIVGRRIGRTKVPWNRGKSLEGSLAMFVCGALMSCGLVQYFHFLGYLACTAQVALSTIAVTSLVSTVVESFPATILDDNISVPLVAAGLSYALGMA